ncbi:MAG TPA: hypothetical protein VJ420_06540 [Candidatus Udaeobacter sp.]|nr:hypothetical protein [Candidatus Udaeobacter sp.]
MRPAEFYSAEMGSGQHARWAHRRHAYVPGTPLTGAVVPEG